VAYQLINPGYISWWVSVWTHLGRLVDFRAPSWMSASICSFVVAAVATLAGGGAVRAARRLRDRRITVAERSTVG
jgi:threonine/homoserine/homoserine lactone efflux protein